MIQLVRLPMFPPDYKASDFPASIREAVVIAKVQALELGGEKGFIITPVAMQSFTGITNPAEGLRFIYAIVPPEEMRIWYDRTGNYVIATYDDDIRQPQFD